MTAINSLYLVLLLCIVVVGAQQVFFVESDFSSSGNITQIKIDKVEANSVAINVSIIPMTISQYRASGKSDCILNSDDDPAEADDFDNTVLHVSFPPSNEQVETKVINLGVQVDDVIEGEEVFVVFLEVEGGASVASVQRNCTVVRIRERFFGQFLRWTRNGRVIESTLSLEFPENSGSQLLITAERLVPTEITTDITASIIIVGSLTKNADFKLNRSYSIPPERSSVDITIDILQDGLIEDDESMTISLTARASGIITGGSQATRTVTVTILDNEVLNYTFLDTPAVINVTEGETVTVTSGIDPTISESRGFELARIITENGTALGSVDFRGLDSQLAIQQGLINPTTINTIFRPGIQPTRTFTVQLLPSNQVPIHRRTHVKGTVTINIMDDSGTPLAPSINALNFSGQNEELLNASWSHINTDRNPVESFLVIIKSCSRVPCNIDPDAPQPGEIRLSLTNNNFNLERQTAFSMPVASIVVCAVNSLGRNCSSSLDFYVPFIVTPPPTTKTSIFTSATPQNTPSGQNTPNNPLKNFTAQPRGPVTTEETRDRTLLILVVPIVIASTLLCCLVMLLLICCCCCCYRRNNETSYYPGKTKGKQLKGESPTSTDNFSVEFYEEEVKISDLKYV